MSKKHHGRHMNENEEVVTEETPVAEVPVVEQAVEPTPETVVESEPAQTEPEVISGPPPAEEPVSDKQVADEALENLRVGFETLKTHSAAKIPGSLIHDAVIPLEKAYLAFKTLMGK
jgi:hypothetical protein